MVSKVILACIIVVSWSLASAWLLQEDQITKTEAATAAFVDDSGRLAHQQRQIHFIQNNGVMFGWGIVTLVVCLMFWTDLQRFAGRWQSKSKALTWLMVSLLCCLSGCYRPFEPVKLEVIKSNEEAFLLPLTGDSKKQESSNNEEYLKANMVFTKQVKIPQQWVPVGFETWQANGKWEDAAMLIKVDKSPVTREWTADPNSGTSKRNEAVWVMTSDQVEFSTGWTITARIDNRDDAVKFLHNYPNGSLTTVMDTEVRSKLQAEFGLEVTDLPMDELRKSATPHINKTVKTLTDFFKNRGISITNLGITGGFVYKDKIILDTMVKVFNAEQEKSMAIAETNAQRERNQKVILKAQGEADAILKTRKAEADGIKMVADARIYELEKAAKQLDAYVQMKQLELQKELLLKWDGAYPKYFIGGTSSPNMLLQLPALDVEKSKAKKE